MKKMTNRKYARLYTLREIVWNINYELMEDIMIHFNVPPFVGTEFKYMHEAVENQKIAEMVRLLKSAMNGLKKNLMQTE